MTIRAFFVSYRMKLLVSFIQGGSKVKLSNPPCFHWVAAWAARNLLLVLVTADIKLTSFHMFFIFFS